MLVVMLLNHLEGDLKLGPCVPVFRRLATFSPIERSVSGAVTPGTTSLSSSRSSGAVATRTLREVDPRTVSDRRSVTPTTIDAADRSACCSAHRDGTGRPTEASAAEARS